MSRKISVRLREGINTDLDRLVNMVGGRRSKVLNFIIRDWLDNNQDKIENTYAKNKTAHPCED